MAAPKPEKKKQTRVEFDNAVDKKVPVPKRVVTARGSKYTKLAESFALGDSKWLPTKGSAHQLMGRLRKRGLGATLRDEAKDGKAGFRVWALAKKEKKAKSA